jgi:hypothetical protein
LRKVQQWQLKLPCQKTVTGQMRFVALRSAKLANFRLDAYVLRLRTAIDEKAKKIKSYMQRGIIQRGEATAIAVSGGRLEYRFAEGIIPKIVRAAFAVGNVAVHLDESTGETGGQSVEYRDEARKTKVLPVNPDIFLDKHYAHISALIYSCLDCLCGAHPSGMARDLDASSRTILAQSLCCTSPAQGTRVSPF